MTSHSYDYTLTSRPHVDIDDRTQFVMTSETARAVDAVKFIAAHLRTEDDYAEVSQHNITRNKTSSSAMAE